MSDKFNILAPELRTTVRKEIDFLKGAWIEFYNDVTVGAIRKAQEAKDTSDIGKSLELIISQIANWNFIDQAGKDLEVSIESLEKLPTTLLTWITEVQTELLTPNEEKKS